MKWENLGSFCCPHCGEKLKMEDEVQCTRCTFRITIDRFKSIAAHRAHPERAVTKMKWQYLIDDRCPVCASNLMPNVEGRYAFMKCISSECTFRIREDKISEIKNDPAHPANVFYNKTRVYRR